VLVFEIGKVSCVLGLRSLFLRLGGSLVSDGVFEIRKDLGSQFLRLGKNWNLILSAV